MSGEVEETNVMVSAKPEHKIVNDFEHVSRERWLISES
jgi:hypothetical protein